MQIIILHEDDLVLVSSLLIITFIKLIYYIQNGCVHSVPAMVMKRKHLLLILVEASLYDIHYFNNFRMSKDISIRCIVELEGRVSDYPGIKMNTIIKVGKSDYLVVDQGVTLFAIIEHNY